MRLWVFDFAARARVFRQTLVRCRSKFTRHGWTRTFAVSVHGIVGAHPHELLLRLTYCWHGWILTGYMLLSSPVIFAIIGMIVTNAVIVAVLTFHRYHLSHPLRLRWRRVFDLWPERLWSVLHLRLHRLWQTTQTTRFDDWLPFQTGDVAEFCCAHVNSADECNTDFGSEVHDDSSHSLNFLLVSISSSVLSSASSPVSTHL